MRNVLFFFLAVMIGQISLAQRTAVTVGHLTEGVYPSNWWVGMKNNKLQLMLHDENISDANFIRIDYPGVKLVKINKVENKNYVFLDLVISASAKPGKFPITISLNKDDSRRNVYQFELKPRRKGNGTAYAQGVRSEDFIYLIMPDRYSCSLR